MRPMPSRVRYLLALAAAALACRGAPSHSDAEALVRRYNALVSDAYRAGDVNIARPVVGEAEARKLAGHIGARLDQGMTLDAQLLELSIRDVAREGEEVVVSTEERWQYAERRVGSGEQVGEGSRDRYELRYHLKQVDRRWLVEGTEFASKPEIGHEVAPRGIDPRTLHGLPAKEDEAAPPGAGAPGVGR
jgi:hypothetical protein